MTDLEVAGVGDYLAERRDDIARLLIELADNESPSLVPESQGAIQEIVSRRLEAIGFVAQFFPGEESGGHLYLSRGEAPAKAGYTEEAPVQLLLGHTDTVWPIGTVRDLSLIHI